MTLFGKVMNADYYNCYYQWNSNFSDPQFFKRPDSLNQKLIPSPKFNSVTLPQYPCFFQPIKFLLNVWEIMMTAYYAFQVSIDDSR